MSRRSFGDAKRNRGHDGSVTANGARLASAVREFLNHDASPASRPSGRRVPGGHPPAVAACHRRRRHRSARLRNCFGCRWRPRQPGLAEPFKGITTNGQVEPGLFGDPLDRGLDRRRSARPRRRFWRDSRQAQRAKTVFAVDDAGVAQVDEPELLRAAGRQLSRDVAGATGEGLRPAPRLTQRQRV